MAISCVCLWSIHHCQWDVTYQSTGEGFGSLVRICKGHHSYSNKRGRGKKLKARQIFLYYWRLDVAYSREWNELIFYAPTGPVKKMAIDIPQHGPRHKLTKLAGLISEDNARGWEVTWLADVLLVCDVTVTIFVEKRNLRRFSSFELNSFFK